MNSKFNCEFCSESYTEERSLRRHKLSRHEGKRFDCSICQKEFTRKSKLKNTFALKYQIKTNVFNVIKLLLTFTL